MKLNVYLKSGEKLELRYPKRKSSETEPGLIKDEESFESFIRDVDALNRLEEMAKVAEFIVLGNRLKQMTIRIEDIEGYELTAWNYPIEPFQEAKR
ncbi:hypothetical protein EXIGUO8H_20360 [Exiguobacterium sp. 8H]|uniref:hypothetical protein n=1 Tax=unclassified Exiguobacterium TaxID=2644629 RepID=UPI0012F0EE30|nr:MULTISPECIES: hypothetical protein [unclassified Exiguobacterium]VXB52683.1 hypothetical protein EXIGUO8A_11429 [Exiguobacterium sp. 8A]VXB53251.1 hypothetical protein EXIGUO8H_20360 [Exiguobacterium sp. 8H]